MRIPAFTASWCSCPCRHLDEAAALARILPEKDVDGFHLLNAGKLMTGAKGVIPCTPRGALYMIRQTGIDLTGKHAVVVGRSNIVGKPMAMLLLRENCTVTVCHSRTRDLAEYTRRADILVAAVGKAGFVTADMVKPGAIVIDVGINRVDGKVRGDVDFDAVKEVAGWITPVPGGVGKMTITMLLQNTLEAAERMDGRPGVMTSGGLSVSELNQMISESLRREPRLRNVTVTAEISGFKHHAASGHWYFLLKDAKACHQLRDVSPEYLDAG